MQKKREKVDKSSYFSTNYSPQQEAPFEALSKVVEVFQKEFKVNMSEVLEMLKKGAAPKEILIPVSVFNKKLGSLETVCKYMKENLGLTYHEIAKLLDRNQRTIWVTCRNASRKLKAGLIVEEGLAIPVSVIANRKLSVLESIVWHLKQQNRTYREIAELLKRDERNIWTVHDRAKKKWKRQ